MKPRFFLLIILYGGLVFSLGRQALARDAAIPALNDSPDHPPLSEKWRIKSTEGATPRQGIGQIPPELAGDPPRVDAPEVTGGPDSYGYTWDNAADYAWVDIRSGGTDTGMSGYSGGQAVGPINLPFSFKFYGHRYNQVWIAASGYLSFSPQFDWPDQQNPLPSSYPPNNVIAPYWTVLWLNSSGPNARVYYKSWGAPGNRRFGVEWFNVKGGTSNDPSGGDETYDFEVILKENGNIDLQYKTMTLNGAVYYASIGIEDHQGAGLGYMDWENFLDRLPGNYRIVKYIYPTPVPRVDVFPEKYGKFTRTGSESVFQIPVYNTGDLGGDTFDLVMDTLWPVSLYESNGSVLLTDTDMDGNVDTGPVPQDSSVMIIAKVQTPEEALLGYNNRVDLYVKSSLNTALYRTVRINTAIPAPFAQVFNDETVDAQSLALVKPTELLESHVTPPGEGGWDMSIAQTLDHSFIYGWNAGRCVDQGCNLYVYEIEYALINRAGIITHPVSTLQSLGGVTMDTYDTAPAISVSPDGQIGLLWTRTQYHASGQFNDNVYFAILTSSGDLVYGPVNLTSNGIWGTFDTLNMPVFYSPTIAATGDNRFMLAWEQYSLTSDGDLRDIYFAIRSTSGGEVRSTTQHTHATAVQSGYYDPALAALDGNRVILAYSDDFIRYDILESDGNFATWRRTVQQRGWHPDVVDLKGTGILLAWTNGGIGRIEYVVLDDTDYTLTCPIQPLQNQVVDSNADYVSLTTDLAGNGIVTWMDDMPGSRPNLYYAMVDYHCWELTAPMPYRTSEATNIGDVRYIYSSMHGNGNTPYCWTAPNTDDASLEIEHSLYAVPLGGTSNLNIEVANAGCSSLDQVVLTATMQSGLTYVSDTSGIPPVVYGTTLTWSFPDLQYLKSNAFDLVLGVPEDSSYGETYTITMQISSASPDDTPENNVDEALIVVTQQVLLPVLSR